MSYEPTPANKDGVLQYNATCQTTTYSFVPGDLEAASFAIHEIGKTAT
jgi:hypothetical protein